MQMELNVERADFVLVLGTPLYAERANLKDAVTGSPKGGVAVEVKSITMDQPFALCCIVLHCVECWCVSVR